MFFNIGHVPLENYPCHWQLGSFSVSTDRGWHHTTLGTAEILYKGYADSAPLNQLLEQILLQTEPRLTGNFCALVSVNDTIEIQTDRYRSFPIYVGNGVNNLVPTAHTAWTDSLISVHSDLSVTENKFDVIGAIDTDLLTKDQVTDKIIEILDNRARRFGTNNSLPVKVFLSGGVDSLLVYSFLKKYVRNVELVLGAHHDWDYFWVKNSSDITRNWGYNQIHHWNQDCVLTSGAPGDEFMLRSPVTADLFLKHQGIRIATLLNESTWKNCLHHSYFMQDKHQYIFETQQSTAATNHQLHHDLCNIVVNDWQHWHLGRTLTWTPLRDLEIFKLMLRLPQENAVDQIMNSGISIDIIERNSPGLSSVLSTQKNMHNPLANLARLVSQ
jgi:hypothetical protein